jgi:hypothetical protein
MDAEETFGYALDESMPFQIQLRFSAQQITEAPSCRFAYREQSH